MWNIQEMKERGKAAFKSNYWPCFFVALLMGLFTGGVAASSRTAGSTEKLQQLIQSGDKTMLIVFFSTFMIASAILVVFKIFVVNPIEVGGAAFFAENTEAGPAPFKTIGKGFQNYGHTFAVLFMRDLYLVLWMLLFIVPAFIKMYSYRMVPYILAEHPELSATEVITRSREMMNGNKWQAFKMDLSFLGWILLGILTLGLVNIFWTAPYMESAQAALYLKLRDKT